MSFTEKLGSLMQRPGQENAPKDDIPWWLKYAGRAAGSAGGVLALGLGFLMCVTFSAICIVMAIWQMVAGFAVVIIEAPCCCLCVEYVTTISNIADQRPLWMRAALYVAISLPAMIFCGGFCAFIGSGLIFVTGTLYGFMALGKKASAEEMRAAAAAETAPHNSQHLPGPGFGPGLGPGLGPGPVRHQTQITSGMKSSLVENAQPMGFTGSPFDSNV